MLKVECRYRAKIDVLNSLLQSIEDDKAEITVDDIVVKLKRGLIFYRSQLAELNR